MSEDIHILQQVSDYLDGIMPPEQRALFEAQITSRPELAALIETESLAREVVIGFEALKLKEQMKKDLAKPKSKAWYWLGLPIIAVISGGIYFTYVSSSEKNDLPAEIIKTAEITAKRNDSVGKIKVTDKPVLSAKPGLPAKVSNETPLPAKSAKQEEQASPRPAFASVPETENKPASQEIFKNDVPEINPCLNLNLKTKYTITPSCNGESTGELHAKHESIKAGLPPYSFSLDGKEFHTGQFTLLKNGIYTLYVKDGNNCVSRQEILIPSVQCGQAKEHSFNPSYDQAWIIPYDENKKARLFRITDKGGQDVYSITVSDGNPAEWHGESNTGLAVSVGYHLFFIEYTDGSVDKGAITILQ